MGDFTNQRKVMMKAVDESVQCPEGATHYIKKVLDPKIYEFKFFIDEVEYVSDDYEVNEIDGKSFNLIDLSNVATKIYIKKQKKNIGTNSNNRIISS